jgi:threonine dehydrogenase-like Zn-dependent dehydrogenase
MRVAIAGVGFASHAEVAAVPVNLVVPMPDEISFEEASTVALGAIALQGVRRAEVSLGDKVAVLGCGAIGILAVQILKTAGCHVFATDLDPERLRLAEEMGADFCVNPRDEDVSQLATQWSDGYGVDVAMVFAATQSSEPVSQGFRMCRRKGRVVLVGVAGGEYKRDDMYQKELDFLISTSYGPGRYDDDYELHGKDYPYGYVRWTEKRNMQAYLDLLANKSVAVSPLITVRASLADAHVAFEKLKAGDRPLLAVLEPEGIDGLESGVEEEIQSSQDVSFDWAQAKQKVSMAITGAGAFVQGMHLPTIAAMSDRVRVSWICSRTGLGARSSAENIEGCQATTNYDDVLRDDWNPA